MELLERFILAAGRAGAHVVRTLDRTALVDYIARHAEGPILLPNFAASQRLRLAEALRESGCIVLTEHFRAGAAQASAGITGANFALADTGTVVLDSTDEALRLASTLPRRHFVILDPHKILADGLAAVGPLRVLHRRQSPDFVAFITGPSRTADIERVLTIGVHGPAELHILLLEGISDDPLES
ncbi:MAG: lactate utilization protein [Desulfuromonadaceae bacterium]|nr:lactate utilization protein [Desulfuromonadaceae bacterium]